MSITIKYRDEVKKFSSSSKIRDKICSHFNIGTGRLLLKDESDRYDVVIDDHLPSGVYLLEVKAEAKDIKLRKKAYPWLHPALEIRAKSPMGHGLFSTQFLPAGTVIWREVKEAQDYLFYTREETLSWPKEEREDWEAHAYMVDEETWSGERVKKGTPLSERNRDDFTNHSCDPSTWMDTDDRVIARLDIPQNGEITYDYCTSECEKSCHVNKWKCLCGAKDCRGELTGNEWMNPKIQEKYEGHWANYLQVRINNMREKAKSNKVA